MSLPLRRRPWFRIFAAIVVSSSIAWVLYASWGAWPEIATRVSAAEPAWLAAGIVVSCGSGLAYFWSFGLLVRACVHGSPSSPRWAQLAHLYFASQLLKHLPGRLWGLGYQAAVGEGVSPSTWVAINVAHMVTATAVALGFALVILAPRYGPLALVLAVAALASMVPLAVFVLSRLSRLPFVPQRWIDRAPGLAALGIPGMRCWARVHVPLVLAVVLQYAGWWMYGAAFEFASGSLAIQLGALYLIAWLAGYLSLVTPSGLGVRELVFVLLASDYPASDVALMAVVGRLSLASVDVLLGLVFATSIFSRPATSR